MKNDIATTVKEKIKVKILKMYPDVKIPEYKTIGSSGCDIYAYIKDEYMTFSPFETLVVPTGIKVAIPREYEIQLRPRSGMSLKTPFRIANSPATIDSDYRGEIGIILQNVSNEVAVLNNNERIAQLIVSLVRQINFVEVVTLDPTKRNENGFGSTGKS